jgi:serine protease Do
VPPKQDTDTPQSKPTQAAAPPPANPRVWWGLLFLIATFGIGYLGGYVAINNSDSVNVSPETRQEIVLQESEVIADVAEEVSKSVVSINVSSQQSRNSFFFGEQQFESQSAGTGIILSEDGLVVTNKHVIPTNTTSLSIVLSDGTEYTDIEIVGRDPFQDIAILQINNVSDLTPARLGDSSDLRVGDKVIAIGNALGRFNNSVTTGIISGLSRPVETFDEIGTSDNYLQTDASINPGNSGGPLVNINGEVIGVNTAIVGGAENIGFSIPINDVKPGITSVENSGELIRPYLGVRFVSVTDDVAKELDLPIDRGALVAGNPGQSAVINDSPADKAGVLDGDVIVRVNDEDITETTSLSTLIGRFQVGDTINLVINRDGQELTLQATLEAVPDRL